MPSGPQPSRTHYDILGVSRTASAEEIKKRFRELARTLHPDVNPNDPNASQKFAEVTTAYKTLSDTLSRSTYDAELSLVERRAQAAQARAGGATSTATYATQAPRPNPPGATPPPKAAAPSPGDEAARLVGLARVAISQHRFVDARDRAQRSLQIRRTAEGYEVLGDVYRLQGRSEDAINMYTMSLQLNPRNGPLMERLQRLARTSTTTRRPERRYDMNSDSPYPTASSNGASAPPRTNYVSDSAYARSMGASVADARRPLAVMLTAVFGYGIAFLMLLYLAMFGNEAPRGVGPIPIPLVSRWSETLIAVLVGSGAALGVTMSLTGAIRRLDDEMIFRRAGSGFVPPMGPIVILLSLASFWAAAILHLLFSMLQEVRTAGTLRVFGAVTIVVVLAGLFYDAQGRVQIFLFGGNVVFLSFLFGWFMGDLFRTD